MTNKKTESTKFEMENSQSRFSARKLSNDYYLWLCGGALIFKKYCSIVLSMDLLELQRSFAWLNQTFFFHNPTSTENTCCNKTASCLIGFVNIISRTVKHVGPFIRINVTFSESNFRKCLHPRVLQPLQQHSKCIKVSLKSSKLNEAAYVCSRYSNQCLIEYF